MTYDATLAELTSLEEMMRLLMEEGHIHEDVINKLWQVYSKSPGVDQMSYSDGHSQALNGRCQSSNDEARSSSWACSLSQSARSSSNAEKPSSRSAWATAER